MRGNIIDMAVGIVIGIAFGAIINSVVNDIIMPPVGLLLGKVDFTNLYAILKQGNTPGPYLSLSDAKAAGAVTLNYGVFINTIISFIIVAFVMFVIIKAVNHLKKKEENKPAETKECPFCYTTINIKAVKCPNCTSDLNR
ncbi:MAG: large conductance mechanosensitive channel protein MscL [Actinobacteria bacterium]|nr:large conductance mechanosensitive channel protein MscL [Actinomycetota bacterium]